MSKTNYGVITEISKELNKAFGDTSGRSVSRRTAHGFKRSLNLDMDDDSAELFVHTGMVVSGKLLNSKDETSKGVGILLCAALFGWYQGGK